MSIKLNHRKLAEGEVTGHFHLAESLDVEIFDNKNGTFEINTPTGTEVTHQEHNTVIVPPGEYVREIVNEFDPFEKEIRKVID